MKAFQLVAIVSPWLLITPNNEARSAEFLLFGFEGSVTEISDDGTVFAGIACCSSTRGWRWNREEGVSFLTPPTPGHQVLVGGMSADGSAIGGSSSADFRTGAGFSGALATVWTTTADDTPVVLGALPGDNRAVVSDLSSDGSVIVGESSMDLDASSGFWWSSTNGMQSLDPLPEDNESMATGVSADGSVIVGISRLKSFVVDWGNQWEREATIWTRKNGELQAVGLGRPNGQDTTANLVSRDGTTVVGGMGGFPCAGCIRGANQAFRWTEPTGMVPLGHLDGLTTTPAGISHDASVIVGNTSNERRGFIWDETNGMRDLQTVLDEQHGIDDLLGWYRVNINTMSADARILGGRVWECDNCGFEAWALFLDRPVHLPLQAGDADQDLDFDQSDVVRVLSSGKYLTGQHATWGEGDWNTAPNIRGDGLFNQLDIVAAQQTGIYLTGPYSAVRPGGTSGDGQTSVTYNAGTGELALDAPIGVELTSINIDSAAGIFTGEAAQSLGGSFDNDADNNIFKATFGGSFGPVSFGNVAQTGLSEEFVLSDLTAVGSLAGGGDLGNVDLVYVPEPTSAVLIAIGLAIGLTRIRRVKHGKVSRPPPTR